MATEFSIEDKLAAMSPRRRELARRLLAQRGVDVAGLFGPTRGPDSGTDVGDVVLYPEPGEWAAYHTAVEVELHERIEPRPLDSALKHVIERHGLAAPALVVEDSADVTDARFRSDGPLLRAYLARDCSSLVLCGHDLAVDHRSLRLLAREVLTRYASGQCSARLPVRFADVRRWREQTLAEGGFDKQLEYWQTALKPIPSRSTGDGSKVGRRIDVPLTEVDFVGASQFARAHGCSVLAVWTAVWSLTVHRGEPFAIGCCLTGRNHETTEDVVGPMANPVFLPFDLRGSPSFPDMVMRARSVIADAVQNSDVPIEVVLAHAAPHLTEDDVRSVTVGHVEDADEPFVVGSLRASARDLYLGYAKEALRLEVTTDRAVIEFRPSRYADAAVFELADRVAANLRERIYR